MSYKFGQFRRSQLDSYSTPLTYTLDEVDETSPLSEAVKFTDKVINLSGENILYFVDKTGTKRRNYFLRIKVYKMWETEQVITVILNNTLKTKDNQQKIITITVPKGYEQDYSTFEITLPPNAIYNQIKFTLNRIVNDYNQINSKGTYGRIVNLEVQRLEEIRDIMNVLNPAIENKGQLKQIGIQGPPGLQVCIDGEEIRLGRSGLYEIKNGIIIKFIGFIVEPDDHKYFILDYQY